MTCQSTLSASAAAHGIQSARAICRHSFHAKRPRSFLTLLRLIRRSCANLVAFYVVFEGMWFYTRFAQVLFGRG